VMAEHNPLWTQELGFSCNELGQGPLDRLTVDVPSSCGGQNRYLGSQVP
jgi:hypothetical protein